MADQRQAVSLSRYLWARLRQIGIDSVHGVPGDYNLNLLDSISSEGLRWVGSCNELNAGMVPRGLAIQQRVIYLKTGYAADGYARVKGISAIVTTGGVGELSAINPHAGAYSEQVAIVHIVGSPALSIRGNRKFNMHHTLGNSDYDVFKTMFKAISTDQVSLYDASLAPKQIDQVLKTCWISNRPVYVDIPADMASKVVDGSRLSIPLDLNYPVSDRNQEAKALAALASKLGSAKRPCILVDMGGARERVRQHRTNCLKSN